MGLVGDGDGEGYCDIAGRVGLGEDRIGATLKERSSSPDGEERERDSYLVR